MKLHPFKGLIGSNPWLALIVSLPAAIFVLTLGRYYGFYYDNHYFNLLSQELIGHFKVYFYLGSHYTVHSSFYSYLLYPLFLIFGPSNFSAQLLSACFHLLAVLVCYKLGGRFFSRGLGLIFAALFAAAPFFLINVYTLSEYSLTVFLNLTCLYYFLLAFEERSRQKMVGAAVIYALSCFHTIYSLLGFPFFALYSCAQLFPKRDDVVLSGCGGCKFFRWPVFAVFFLAYLYAVLLLKEMFMPAMGALYGSSLIVFAGIFFWSVKRLSGAIRERIKFSFLFIFISLGILLLLDLLVQIDINLFHQRFGYYRDTGYVGGFGTARVFFYFAGRQIKILGQNIYFSVISSLFAFTDSYTRGSLNLIEINRVMLGFYKGCFPPVINIFFIAGALGACLEFVRNGYKNSGFKVRLIFPLVWLIATSAAFVNTEPLNVRRIALAPMPYLFAGLGILYAGSALRFIAGIITKGSYQNKAALAAAAGITCSVTLSQLVFLKREVFDSYKYQNFNQNSYHFFHNWPYGRTYQEAGDFLLRDAPLKKGQTYRSIIVSIIPPNWFYGSIEWYTRDKIKVIYDLRYAAYINYGTKAALALYLNGAFLSSPDIEAVYFLDVVDPKGENNFFSRLHGDIPPYKVIDTGKAAVYDCLLYKFSRESWQEQLGVGIR
ncbi:MAG: hypothetical protein A3G38_00400 [Omnitrophica WOR_2 bacterium RIFCSPLOWO2_12_FULL_51_8]|nr:MAG: hypothetical protein A3G38_00400 [Omnitrophica WOR_2 bacterium RIFCSPLOWO2_12_FULL_51_8]